LQGAASRRVAKGMKNRDVSLRGSMTSLFHLYSEPDLSFRAPRRIYSFLSFRAQSRNLFRGAVTIQSRN